MSRKHVPLVAGLVLCGGLAVILIALGALSANAAGSQQAATPTPVAVIGRQTVITTTLSANPADDLTTATLDLHAGYIMDPYLLPVVGKTEMTASSVVSGCNGFVGTMPSVTVNWDGKTDQLNVFVYSDNDGVLAIQKPDGSFVCNDDAGPSTVDPLVTLKAPVPGAYRIHVGAAKQDQPTLGFLAITQASLDDARLAELDLGVMLRRRARPQVQPLLQLDAKKLLTGRPAIFGSSELQADFKPVQAFAAGGGEIAAIRLEDQKMVCAGYLTAVPSYSFTWTGKPQALRLFFEGLKDSSLAVVTPDQKVVCGMDSATGNLNPAVDITSPAAGKYQIYIASMAPNTVVGGRLTITGDVKATPAVLPSPAGQ